MKKIFFIVIFAVSVILNIFSMVNYTTRKEQVFHGVYQSLKNISVLLGGIKNGIESENSGAIDYNNRELSFCCRELGMLIDELCYGVSPVRDYDLPILGLELYNEFALVIYEKDKDAITFYMETIDELIEELSEQEASSSSDDDFAKGIDESLTLKAIMNEFKLFNEKICNYR